MKPSSIEFPTRITIELPEPVRKGLEAIADRERHDSDEQLVQIVLSRGIVLTLSDAADVNSTPTAEEVARNLKRLKEHLRSLKAGGSKLSSQATVSPFAAPSVRYRDRRKRLGIKTPEEIQAANSGGGEEHDAVAPDVERYIGAPISEELRLRLEKFLRNHPELKDLEEGIAILLGQGLDKAESGGKARTATDKMLRVAERLYAKAVRGCSA